jgi:hypothetical protein
MRWLLCGAVLLWIAATIPAVASMTPSGGGAPLSWNPQQFGIGATAAHAAALQLVPPVRPAGARRVRLIVVLLVIGAVAGGLLWRGRRRRRARRTLRRNGIL